MYLLTGVPIQTNETNISTNIVPNMKKAQNIAWIQEIKEIKQSIQVQNVELRRLLQEAEEEKQMLKHQLQAKGEALEDFHHNKPKIKCDSSISCYFYDDYFTTFEKHTT